MVIQIWEIDIIKIWIYKKKRIITKKVLGSQIIDYLEFASRNVKSEYKNGTSAVGELGAFANVSGLKYTVDTSIEPSIEIGKQLEFVRVTGERRVKNVKVLVDGAYVDIDPDAYYVVASNNYILLNAGDGNTMLKDGEVVPNKKYLDYEIVIDYIVNELHGTLATKYTDIEGRITIE